LKNESESGQGRDQLIRKWKHEDKLDIIIYCLLRPCM